MPATPAKHPRFSARQRPGRTPSFSDCSQKSRRSSPTLLRNADECILFSFAPVGDKRAALDTPIQGVISKKDRVKAYLGQHHGTRRATPGWSPEKHMHFSAYDSQRLSQNAGPRTGRTRL